MALLMVEHSLSRIRRKTIVNILRAVGEVTDTVRFWIGSISRDLTSGKDIENLSEKMRECLNPKGGEITARYNTVSLGNLYLNLSDVGKGKFLRLLSEEFSPNKENINNKISAYQKNIDRNLNHKLQLDLLTSLEPPRLIILKQFISLPDGLKFIVDMRADVINLKNQHKSLSLLERDLRNILSSWFDVGLLDLCQITWDSPASLLEKLITYEAVHEISSWDDLRNRLDSDRRCFAFFHYKMPKEPLIFVEIALVDTITDNIQTLLDENIPTKNSQNAKVAIFYSISNTQLGLSGINLGNFLIKRVVSKLSEEFKNIKTYATLSPIPGFLKWLKTAINEQKILDDLKITLNSAEILDHINLIKNNDYSENIKNIFLKLCAYYLIKVKNCDKALDPVAHFHLSNGAVIRKLNWMADTSKKGLNQSVGIMVNYHYELNKIDDNHENYIVNKKVNCTKGVLSLLKC